MFLIKLLSCGAFSLLADEYEYLVTCFSIGVPSITVFNTLD